MHLMEFREALEDALASEAMATEIRNNRALMFGKLLAGNMKYELGDLENAETVLSEAMELAKSMSSNRLQGQILQKLGSCET